jgi:anti-sigma factor RsiW
VRHLSDSISAFLDGELTGVERGEFVAHIGTCGRCALEMEEIQAVRTAIRSLPVLDLPGGLFPHADEGDVPLHRHRGLWVGAAAAILAIVVAIAALVTPAPATLTLDDLNSRFGARASLDPAFGPAKVFAPGVQGLSE